jgi:cyclomaltodextrinase
LAGIKNFAMNKTFFIIFIALLFLISLGCKNNNHGSNEIPSAQENSTRYQPKEYVQLQHPEWSINATIYEVNIRQYTSEGTFKAFENHLQRLKAMGVDILWLMPIHPIGEKGRKGTLGSPYAVKDYYGINSEFGDMQSFRHLVDTIHAMGMHVIIDWVANHSARDNRLVTEHPDWYIKSRENNFVSTPWRDYDDIIDFDYS